MGSFSFIRADVKGSANILYGDTVKLLIPIEFGGGYIKGKYVDYGRIDENGIEYDIYELAGIWNSPKILKALKGLFSNPARKQSDIDIWDSDNERNLTDIIRYTGINLTIYNEDHAKVKYPIKIVGENVDTTYEQCYRISFTDPTQGFVRWSWKKWEEMFSTELGYAEYFEKCKKTKKRKTPIKEVENDIAKAVNKINSLNKSAETILKKLSSK